MTRLVAIVGRPNVGKSTLFNRLVGKRQAVVSTTRGTTRDRLYGHTTWRGTALTLVDTGGLEVAAAPGLSEQVQQQVRRALEEADAVVLLCDAQEGLLPADEILMARLRTQGKPMILAVNKAEPRLVVPPEFFALGLSSVFAVSALHGLGVGALLDHLVALPLVTPAPSPAEVSRRGEDALRRSTPLRGLESRASVEGRNVPPPASRASGGIVAIVGRQNVGKSSLFNMLLRDQRAIVHARPGTTRDVVDATLVINGEQITLLDTAGLRHRRKVKDPIDTFSMSRTLEALQRCDVALLLLDATQRVTHDDQRLAAAVIRAGCGLLLLVNKWDLMSKGDVRTLEDAVHRLLPAASFAQVLAISAVTGFQVHHAFRHVQALLSRIRQGLEAAACRELFNQAWALRTPPRVRGRVVRLQQAEWGHGRPIRIELTTRPVSVLPMPYRRALLKRLYQHPQLRGVPIRLVMRERSRRR